MDAVERDGDYFWFDSEWGRSSISPDFGLSDATFNFTGIPGSGTTSAAGADTVTETIGLGNYAASIVYTAESGNPDLYQVTSVSEGGHTKTVTPTSSSPTFAFDYSAASQTTTVVETITNANSVETLTYTSGTDGYALTQDTLTIDTPSTTLPNGGTLKYSFSSTGEVTETVGQGAHTHSFTEPLNPTATFTGLSTNTGSTPNTVTETYIFGDAVTTTTYDGSASGGYAVAATSTTYIPSDGATPALDVNPFDRADFDFMNDTVTSISPSGAAGTPNSMSANNHISYSDLGSGGLSSGDFVAETFTFGSHSSYDLFFSSTGAGASNEYMEVAHGWGAASSLSLTGIAAQLTSLNAVHQLVT